MAPEKLRRSLRRFKRRTASLRRRTVAVIQSRSERFSDSLPVFRRGELRRHVRPGAIPRGRTRQELQSDAEWRQEQLDIGLS